MSIPSIVNSGSTPWPRQQHWQYPIGLPICIDEAAALVAGSGPNAPSGLEADRLPTATLMALQADMSCHMVLDTDLLDNGGADEQNSETVCLLLTEVTNGTGGAIGTAAYEVDWTGGRTDLVENRLYHNGPEMTKVQRAKIGQRLRIVQVGY